jgi:hypothetical protein
VLLIMSWSVLQFAVKLSGAYSAEDLSDRLKWVASEIIQDPLDILMWFLTECEDGKPTLDLRQQSVAVA